MVLDQSLLSLLLSAVLEAILEARTFMTPWNQCNCMPTMLYKQMPCIFTCKRGPIAQVGVEKEEAFAALEPQRDLHDGKQVAAVPPVDHPPVRGIRTGSTPTSRCNGQLAAM